MRKHKCNVCMYLVRYVVKSTGEFSSVKCCRYPMAEDINDPDDHRCGELVFDYDELLHRQKQDRWKFEDIIQGLKYAHNKQVNKLRTKYRNLKIKGGQK